MKDALAFALLVLVILFLILLSEWHDKHCTVVQDYDGGHYTWSMVCR